MIVAVDTGGTKTLIASFTDDGKIDQTIKYPTPKDTDDYIKTLVETLENNFLSPVPSAITIALPGITRDGNAVWCQNLGWKDFPIVAKLSQYLKNIPIFIENDANLAGLSEALLLDSPQKIAVYITISTGIGIGVISDNKIDPAMKDSEIGHSILSFNNQLLEWEQFASGRAIKEVFGKYASEINDEATWRDIAERISVGLLSLIPAIQPDTIIFGGSIGTYFDKYKTYLEDIIKDKLPKYIKWPSLVKAKHPEQAVVYGCYEYAKSQIANQ